jgi:ketosteroid isomerase-like protein
MSLDDELLAREAELRHAQLTSDVEALSRLLDDSLMFTSLNGAVVTKNDDLSLHRSGRFRITRMEPIEHNILHLGETSIVSTKMDSAAILDGSPMEAILRYTRVWHKKSGEWRVVAGHMSTVPR